MGIFNTFKYDDGSKYGNQSKLAYSSAPFKATAIGNFNVGPNVLPQVLLTWANPQGTIEGFRVVRNQDGFSENEEDGHIIYETFNPVLPPFTNLYDQLFSVPLLQGRYAYYTIWVLLADNSWYLSASDVILIPESHSIKSPEGIELVSSEEKFVGLLPRAFTSKQGSNLDEIDTQSDLFLFLGGFAYTLDEILTFADLMVDSMSGKDVNPNFVSVMSTQFGLPNLPDLSLKTQKRLIRQAIYLYQHKGTSLGLQTFIESLTGYAPTITLSPNLLISSQDSSFYKTSGNWVASSSGTLSAVSNFTLSAIEPYAVDKVYCGKVITSASTQTISLGNDAPIFNGVPVTPGVAYLLSYYVTATTSGKTITPTITWYDYTGTVIGSPVSPSAASVTTSWARQTYTATSPAGAAYMGLTFTFSAAGTYYLDMIQLADSSDARSAQYHPANGVEIYLAPAKVNYLENPSFANYSGDVDDTEWVVTGYTGSLDYSNTTTVPGVLDGSHMLHVTTSSIVPVTVTGHTDSIPTGSYYTFSIYLKTDSGSFPLNLSLSVFDSSTNTVVTFNGQPLTAVVTPTNEVNATWDRYSVTIFVPALTTPVYLVPSVYSTTAQTGDLYFDAAQLEAGYTSTDYFDGSYITRGAEWAGTINDSESIAYPNKLSKLNLLQSTIAQFLPVNTPYVVTTGFGDFTTIETLGFSS